MEDFSVIKFPIIKNISVRPIADDIKGFNPSNENDVAEMGKIFGEIFGEIRKEFDLKGIEFPKVVIDSTSDVITYGIKSELKK